MKEKIKVYATHTTAILWYTSPPDLNSYYIKEIKKSEMSDKNIYIDQNELEKLKHGH